MQLVEIYCSGLLPTDCFPPCNCYFKISANSGLLVCYVTENQMMATFSLAQPYLYLFYIHPTLKICLIEGRSAPFTLFRIWITFGCWKNCLFAFTQTCLV